MDATLIDTESTFATVDWGLDRRIIKAVMKLGLVHPTLVQSRSVPLALEGKDLLVRARTGSGKTLAYSMPLLHKILVAKSLPEGADPAIRAVVLVPTRELCEQTKTHLWELMHYCRDVVKLVALGSESITTQCAWLNERPDILVATPGRLVAHLRAKESTKDLGIELRRTVETLVVDEADLVFSYGYSDDIRTIVAHLPRICQSFLMSATLSDDLEKLKKVVLHSPVVLKLEEGSSDGALAQWYVGLRSKDKDLLIYALLKLNLVAGKTIFFVNSVDRCYRLKLLLEQFSVRSAVLNSELPERSRLHILKEFNKGIFDYLICTDASIDQVIDDESEEDDSEESDDEQKDSESIMKEEEGSDADASEDGQGSESSDDDDSDDSESSSSSSNNSPSDEGGEEKSNSQAAPTKKVATKSRKRPRKEGEYGVARGVDFRGVSTVINVDFPRTATSYTHRIGRTARGGASGTALSFVNIEDPAQLSMLKEVQDSQPHIASSDSAVAPATTDEEERNGTVDTAAAAATLAQPAPLALDMNEIERFRYRVEDVRRAVTRASIRDARMRELKQEILNSERLESHFEENPRDLQILQHDSLLLPSRVQPHVGHVPSYLMPGNMAASETALGGVSRGTTRRKRRKNGTDDDRDMRHSTAGRVRWQQRMKKGKFSGKKRRGRAGKKDALF